MTTETHLSALHLRRSNERIRRDVAKTKAERDLRSVWTAQIEKEIEGEEAFIGLDISDDDLLAALQE